MAVCRELTKRFEEILRGPAGELAARLAAAPKGEITLVIAAGDAPAPDPAEALAAVADLVEAGTPRKVAADVVARLSGMSRNGLYRGSL